MYLNTNTVEIQILVNTNVFKYESNTLESISNTFTNTFRIPFIFRMYYCVGKRKATDILRYLVYKHNYCFAHIMTGRPVLGSIVIANYNTVITYSKTSIHRSKGQNVLFVMLSQEVHNKMPMLPSEETLLPVITARIL